MNAEEFKNFNSFLQNTQAIGSNPALRIKAYSEFNDVFDYLEQQTWDENHLIERHIYSNDAVFQNTAEGYFRLGFIESVFFKYSRLVYELWYKKVIEYQDKVDKRIHKGTQVHQIAEILQIQDKNNEAWDYFLAGFTEDVIESRDYFKSQAFRALIAQHLSKNNLVIFAESIKKLKGKETFNPLQIVEYNKRNSLLPSFEENESIDLLKLNKAQDLWNKLLKEREEHNDK